MRRRDLFVLLGGALTAPFTARAQQPARLTRGYIEGHITHPFSAHSAWNTPIDPARIVYTDPSRIENQQFRDTNLANPWVQFEPDLLFLTPPNSPTEVWQYDVFNNGGTFSSGGSILIATPPNLLPTHGSDGWSIFTDLDGVHIYETWMARKISGIWHVGELFHYRLDGTGWGNPVTGSSAGCRAAGAALLGGLIQPAELVAGVINHAMALELDDRQLRAVTLGPQFVPPAVSADSDSVTAYTGTIPMGARFAIPPTVDLATVGLTPEALAVARALQTYGGYVVDAAGATCSIAMTNGTKQQFANIIADCLWIRDNLVMVLPA